MEVLVTIGIIGVVVAMTLGILLSNYEKHATATKLKGFYSKINQALLLSINENGKPEDWVFPKQSNNYNETLEFVNRYFTPYLKLYQCQNIKLPYLGGSVGCAMNDGGGIVIGACDGLDIYYVTDFSLLLKYVKQNKDFRKDLKHSFAFQMNKIISDGQISGIKRDTNIAIKNLIIPYIFNWDGKLETLKNQSRYGCNKKSQYASYCAKWIMENNWEIPKDYPW